MALFRITRRMTYFGVACILALIGIVGGLGGFFQLHDISLTQEEAQSKINERLQRGPTYIQQATVTFQKDRILLSFVLGGRNGGVNFFVRANATGNLVYDDLMGAFYFKAARLEVLDLRVQEKSISELPAFLIRHWIAAEKIVAQSGFIGNQIERIAYASATATVEQALERIPVYVLPHTLKGNLFRMILKSVEVSEGKITAHLSFWQLSYMVLFYLFILLLAIGFAVILLVNPNFGVEISDLL